LNKYLISNRGSLHLALQNGMVALLELIFWLLNFPFMLMVYQEPMILQWAKVVTVIPLTINSQDKSDEDYRLEP
jgi:DMSO reductase anchor subunit